MLRFLLLFSTSLLSAAEVLIVADEFPAMEVVAGRLRTGAGAESRIVAQTEMPPDLAAYQAVIVYIHKLIGEPAETALIQYAENGGKLILLHHSISSGKRGNRYLFPFLGVTLPEGAFEAGGYKWIDPVDMELINLAPTHFITTKDVAYAAKVEYASSDLGGGTKKYSAIPLKETEVYLNHVFQGDRTLLLGVKYRDPKSGVTYMQDRGGWYKKAGKGLVFYYMTGHSSQDFENSAYMQILINTLKFKP